LTLKKGNIKYIIDFILNLNKTERERYNYNYNYCLLSVCNAEVGDNGKSCADN